MSFAAYVPMASDNEGGGWEPAGAGLEPVGAGLEPAPTFAMSFAAYVPMASDNEGGGLGTCRGGFGTRRGGLGTRPYCAHRDCRACSLSVGLTV
jgi:hypothetical protein